MSLIHAFDLLTGPPVDAPDVVACFGNDATLRSWVLQALSAEGDVTQFDGEETRWSDLRDDLATASLFDLSGKRTIVVRGADKFVSEHRPEIEKYVASPGGASRLILELDVLAANTRLYKALSKDYLVVACGSDSKAVKSAARIKFLTSHVAGRYETKLTAGAAAALVEMLGDEIGMLDTEIAKLALYLAPGETINEELVRDVVAGWQGKTIWEINDAIASGNTAEALRQLDKLMSGGQRPIALLPQMAWSLRRLAMATAVVEHRERCGRKWTWEEVLSGAGMRRPDEIRSGAAQLQALTRQRGKQLMRWLLDADLRLKGTHSSEGPDRLLLEQLVIKLAATP